jgi:competence ComEA-like helix-hairpin-helix protein
LDRREILRFAQNDKNTFSAACEVCGFLFLLSFTLQAEARATGGQFHMRAMRSITGALISGLVALVLCAALQAEKHPPAKPIDLNLANAKELEELPGVGPVTAQRIIDLRQKSGRFKRVEDLLAVRGISQKKLDAIRPFVTVSALPASPPRNSAPPPGKK